MKTASSSSISRQLELTINALARSVRKALRTAEKEAPTGKGGPWEVVEHRLELLEGMMKMVGEFNRAEVEEPEEEAVVEAPVEKKKPVPAPKPQTHIPPAPLQIRHQQAGKGWKVAA